MKTIICITIIAVLVGLQVPALAGWTFTPGIAGKSVCGIGQPTPSWTANVRAHSIQPIIPNVVSPVSSSVIVKNAVVSRPVASRNAWMLQSRPSYAASYVKTEAEAKIMTPQVFTKDGRIQSADVPEPGSIVGLSSCLLGFVFQIRRTRKRN